MDAMVIQGTPDVEKNGRPLGIEENSAPTAGSSEVGAWRWSCEVTFLGTFFWGKHLYAIILGGGNSNIFYVHPEPWGNELI